MKKIFLSFLLTVVFSANAFAADYYSIGVSNYKKGSYDKACVNFETAVKINPKNVNARYYLAQSYLMQDRTSDAIDQYNRIILLSPDSDAARLSQRGLFLIKQSERGIAVASAPSGGDFSQYGDNYLDYVLTAEGKIMKWPAFPISVYVQPSVQKNLVQNAFQIWQEKSKSLVKFNFISSSTKAQIVVTLEKKLENSSADQSYIAGYSKPYYQNNNIIKSEIHILSSDPDTGEPLGDDFIVFSTLHEIGHSLGFKGHSPNEKDVMAASADAPKTVLSQRDINTLYAFYKIDEKTLLARNKGQTDVQLQQALDYVKKSPDKAVGWANLADIYKSKKMYPDAIKNYKKALSIEPDKAELYNLLGVAYVETGESQNAFDNLKKACDLDPSNNFYLYQFGQYCLKSGHKEIGKSYIASYLNAHPQDISDEKIQSLLKSYN